MPFGLVQDNSLNPGTGDKVTFCVATHLATAKAAEKAGGANSKYAGMSNLVAWTQLTSYTTQHSRDRLHSSVVSPCSVRQGLQLGTTESLVALLRHALKV